MLQHVSYVDVFHWVAWLLLVGIVVQVGASIVVAIFGDRNKSPLDRWATWVAFQLKDDDGNPLVKAGSRVSVERKVLSVLYFLFVLGAMAWFAWGFSGWR
jgi:hypothetical protein